MGKETTPVVKRSLFSWVLPGNVKLQVVIVLCITVTVFARLLPLEMQKRIINQAISLKKLDLLYYYCGIYLAAVLFSNGLKFVIVLLQNLIGQKVLAAMRQELFHHILTLPINFFRKTPAGVVVNSILTELVSAGGFAGEAIASPLINLLTLVVFAIYLFTLNPLLAAFSLAIYPFVLFLVPRLQRRSNKANRKRVDLSRTLSNKITETVTGIHEVHGNGSFGIENKKFDGMVERLFRIRIVWEAYKQAVKLTNNFFVSLSPFIIFLLGGYLAMNGKLELGSLVAFLSAQERLYDPWKELIAFYQLYQDASVKYGRTMEYFDTEPDHKIEPVDRKPYDLEGSIEISDVSFVTEEGIRLIEGVNLNLKPGEHLALVGFSGSGKSTLAMCIGQLYKYSTGHIMLGNKEVTDLTKADMVNNIGVVAQAPYIFDGSIEENLLYSCDSLNNYRSEEDIVRPSLDEIIGVLQQTGVFVDVLRFGLNTMIHPGEHQELVETIIRIREKFQEYYWDELADYVEFFDENRYLYFSSVSENLTFGTPNKPEFMDENLAKNDYFLSFLDQADLTRTLLSLGAELSRQTVDILGNVTPDRVFFEQSPIAMEEFDDFKLLVERLKKKKLHQISDADRNKLLELALRFNPGKHKMIGLQDILKQLILEGRAMFRDMIAEEDPEAFTFFKMSEYLYSQTLLNNILFGKTKTSRTEAQDKINQSIIQLLIEEDLLEAIVEIGMQFQVGTKGDNLSGGQRQKLAIARAFLKGPGVLIMDEATSALDNKSQARVQNQLDTKWKGKSTVVAVVHRLDITKTYDKIAVMKAGKIVETGPYDDLIARKGMLYELVYGKK